MTSGNDESRPHQIDVHTQGIKRIRDPSQRRNVTSGGRSGRRGICAARKPPSRRDPGYLCHVMPDEAVVKQKTGGNLA